MWSMGRGQASEASSFNVSSGRRKLSDFDGVQSSIRRNDEVMRRCHLSPPKMLSVAYAFKISDHQYNPLTRQKDVTTLHALWLEK
jgi:hypothetical protein